MKRSVPAHVWPYFDPESDLEFVRPIMHIRPVLETSGASSTASSQTVSSQTRAASSTRAIVAISITDTSRKDRHKEDLDLYTHPRD